MAVHVSAAVVAQPIILFEAAHSSLVNAARAQFQLRRRWFAGPIGPSGWNGPTCGTAADHPRDAILVQTM